MNTKLANVQNLRYIRKAFSNTRREMIISLGFVLALTMLLAWIFYLVESIAQPDVFTNFFDAFVWAYTRYIEGGDGVFDGGPITVTGKVIASLFGFIGIAIVAIPAGLIGSGFMDAVQERKREKELAEYRTRLVKAFRRSGNKSLRAYLNTLPKEEVADYATLNIVPNRIPMAKVQVSLGMDFKDVFDTCKKYPELRIKNQAQIHSDEDEVEDRFLIELCPINRPYGCFINRGSKVTIAATGSVNELGMGWWTYYLAKFAGFNYICKEVEIDLDEPDSFYNMKENPSPEKQKRRELFLSDLQKVCAGEDSWLIIMTEHIRTSENTTDFHWSSARKGGADATVHDTDTFDQLFADMDREMSSLGLTSVQHSARYPLLKRNLAYVLRDAGIKCNTFVLRPSAELVNVPANKLELAFRMGQIIRRLDPSHKLLPAEIADLKATGFGYMEHTEKV